MRVIPTVMLTALAASSLLAQYSEQLDRCMDKANTQLAINSCANEEAKRADAELNGIYQKLLLAARKESGATDKIGAAERAWVAYRHPIPSTLADRYTIRLKPELEALIQKDVERSPYQSADEFVEQAVQMLHEQEQWLADNRADIAAKIEKSYASAER